MTSRESRTALVAGCAGFIGSHLVEKLLGAGYRVLGVDKLDDYYPSALKVHNMGPSLANRRFTFDALDLADANQVSAYAARQPAARRGRASGRPPWGALVGDRPCALRARQPRRDPECARRMVSHGIGPFGLRQLEFGVRQQQQGPLRRDRALHRAAQPVRRDQARLRAPLQRRASGPWRADHDVALLHGLRAAPTPRFGHSRIRHCDPATSRGHRFGDGSMARDFTHVSDIVRGIARAMEETSGLKAVNLGNSSPCTVSTLVEKLGRALEIDPLVRRVDRPAGEMDVTFANVQKAADLWGWRPETTFDDGLRDFAAWLRAEERAGRNP